MMKTLDTSLRARVRPDEWSAARTVSAVLLAAPPTLPSASPAATIRAAKYSGFLAISAASTWVMPLARRRS